jgi:WD40 repeat protein
VSTCLSSDASAEEWIAKGLGKIETGHPKTVRLLSWSPSGTALATASFDATIGIWEHSSLVPSDSDTQDTRSGLQELDASKANRGWECASLLEGHENECKSVVYSASGTLLATCARGKTVWIWKSEFSNESSR